MCIEIVVNDVENLVVPECVTVEEDEDCCSVGEDIIVEDVSWLVLLGVV